MITDKELYIRYSDLRTKKSTTVSVMQHVANFFEPSDNVLLGKTKVGLTGGYEGELLDTTGTDLVDEYVSYVLGIYYNTDTKWFTLRHRTEPALSDTNRILNKQADVLYELISNTNYYAVVPSLERDVLIQGHGFLHITPSDTDFAKCKTISPFNIYAAVDSYNFVKYLCGVETLSGIELRDLFPSIIHNTTNRMLMDKDLLDKFRLLAFYLPAKEPFVTAQDIENADVDNPKMLIKFLALPYADTSVDNFDTSYVDIDETLWFRDFEGVFTRDRIHRDIVYGLGIGKKALVKSRILNKLMHNQLRLAGLSSNPPRVQDPVITAETGTRGMLQEGQVFTMGMKDATGRPIGDLIKLLEVTGSLEPLLALYQIVQGQLAAMLPTAGQIYKVARQSVSELQNRMSEQEKRLAPLRSAYIMEGPQKHVKLFYKFAERQGYFNTDSLKLPAGVSADTIDFNFDAFLMDSFRQGKALRASQALALTANALTLKPSGIARLNVDQYIKLFHDGFNVLGLLNSREETERELQVQQQEIQRQQQMQQLEALNQQASSNVDMIGAVSGLLGGQDG